MTPKYSGYPRRIYIGAWKFGDFDPFYGLIDEVLIYNRSLSKEEIEACYKDISNCPRDESLVLHLSFDEGRGKYVNDLSFIKRDKDLGNYLEFDGCIDEDKDGYTCEKGINEVVIRNIKDIDNRSSYTLSAWFMPYYQDSETYENHNDIFRGDCVGGPTFGISTSSDFNKSHEIWFEIEYANGTSCPNPHACWWLSKAHGDTFDVDPKVNPYKWNYASIEESRVVNKIIAT